MFIALFRIVDLFTICTVFRWIAHHKNVHVRGSLFISIHAYIFIYYQGKPSKKAALSPSKQFEKPSVRKKYRRPPKVHSLQILQEALDAHFIPFKNGLVSAINVARRNALGICLTNHTFHVYVYLQLKLLMSMKQLVLMNESGGFSN